jgi:hypothetical protein
MNESATTMRLHYLAPEGEAGMRAVRRVMAICGGEVCVHPSVEEISKALSAEPASPAVLHLTEALGFDQVQAVTQGEANCCGLRLVPGVKDLSSEIGRAQWSLPALLVATDMDAAFGPPGGAALKRLVAPDSGRLEDLFRWGSWSRAVGDRQGVLEALPDDVGIKAAVTEKLNRAMKKICQAFGVSDSADKGSTVERVVAKNDGLYAGLVINLRSASCPAWDQLADALWREGLSHSLFSFGADGAVEIVLVMSLQSSERQMVFFHRAPAPSTGK